MILRENKTFAESYYTNYTLTVGYKSAGKYMVNC